MGENDFAVVVASVDFESGASSSVLLDLVIILYRRNLRNRLREHSGSVEEFLETKDSVVVYVVIRAKYA